jgi:hypothetical protein
MKIEIPACGSVGVIKDRGSRELPLSGWSDSSNMRFLDGAAQQFYGHGQVYNTPAYAPQYLMPINVAGARYWLYATATKQFVVTNSVGVTTHTDITHVTARAGVVNQWSGFVFFGVPILNVGDTSKIPMYWDQDLTHKFGDLTNWPAGVYCKALRQYKNFMIAMNITAAGVSYPHRMRWSHPADPGSLPSSWDVTDATKDAGQFDVGDDQGPLIDGLGLKNSFILYKEQSTHALDYVGGAFVMNSRKVFGMSGIMNLGCAVEFDAFHFVVTGSDVVIHDGYTATSVLDKRARRFFFQDIDVDNKNKVHCSKNPFLNEIFVNYPSIGATSCNKALVYNFVDKTVGFRTLPNVNHMAYGPVDNSLGGTYDQDSDPVDSDLTAYNGPDFTPDTVRVMMGSADVKLFMLDASASFDGSLPSAYVERRGVDFGMPESYKLVTGIRPRITGNVGATVTIKVGAADDINSDPTYTSMTYTIGEDLKVDCLVSGRYLSFWFGTGTAYQWRLDSFDVMVEQEGGF